MRQGKEEVDAIEPHPVDLAEAVRRAWFPDRSAARSRALADESGHIALCNAG